MNLYFLVEGTTESKFYPAFVAYYLNNRFTRVDSYDQAMNNHYYLIGTNGYPFIFTGSSKAENNGTALKNAIKEVNDNPVYDYLIVCLDADETTISEKIAEFENYVTKYKSEGVELNNKSKFKIVIQNRSIETWFLGNRKLYSTNPKEEPLISYARYYNVKKDDPELMANYRPEYTIQDFHYMYLRAMLQAKRMTYKKENIENTVAQQSYIEQLIKRIRNNREKHLLSFADFVNFCDSL